jgi:hypothetical protein
MDHLAKPHAKQLLDRISSSLDGAETQIEIAGLDVGDQVEQRWAALTGITYDLKSDVITISTKTHTHHIQKPLDLHAEWSAGCLEQLILRDPEGHRYFVKFRRPLMLPAGERARRPS